MRYLLGPRYARVDFSIPDTSWRLDAVDKVDLLEQEGFAMGDATMPRLRASFFAAAAPDYQPFLR
jgi:hypothetical protein